MMNKVSWLIVASLVLAFFVSFSWAQHSGYTELTDHLADDDWVYVVDISDTTMAATGTNKKVAPYSLRYIDVVPKTADYTILSTDNGKMFTNYGEDSTQTYTLPDCVASPSGTSQVGEGWNVRFAVIATYAIYVDPTGNDSIFDFSNGEAGEYIYSDTTAGSALTIVCMREAASGSGTENDGYNYMSLGYVGTWTAQD